jgi:hypothetical protein
LATEQTDAAASNGKSGKDKKETLSVTDNRTGESYEMEITDGTVKAMDFRQIKVSEEDFGLMTYDPAFTNTASCRSEITYIDGDAGILEHRGIPIEQLCEKSTYLEVAYLLIFGELPTEAQLDRWVYDITHHTFVHEDMKQFESGFRYDAHPMGMLLACVGALSTFYPGSKEILDPEERYMAAIRMIEDEGLLEHVDHAAEAFRTRLHALKDSCDAVRDVRVMGMMIGVELSIDGAAVVQACLDRNLLVNATQGRVIRLLPAMTITQADVEEGCEKLAEAIREVAARGAA